MRLLAAAAAALIVSSAASISSIEASKFGVIARSSRLSSVKSASSSAGQFGLSKNISVRGGSTEEEPEVAPVAEKLYLPGLLDATVVASSKVCNFCPPGCGTSVVLAWI